MKPVLILKQEEFKRLTSNVILFYSMSKILMRNLTVTTSDG